MWRKIKISSAIEEVCGAEKELRLRGPAGRPIGPNFDSRASTWTNNLETKPTSLRMMTMWTEWMGRYLSKHQKKRLRNMFVSSLTHF